jgi:predicted NUDIX family phosphoesterase
MGEVVLAYPREAVDDLLDQLFLDSTQTREGFGCAVSGDAVWEDRAVLKARATEKQPIDYTFFIILNDDQNKPDLLSVYQRAKTVGEEKLMGLYSLGYSGHVDFATDRRSDGEGNTDFFASLEASREREVGAEEIEIIKPRGSGMHPTVYSHFGWINDNSNAIGQIHFAALSVATLPAGSVIESKEPNQIIRGMFSLRDLLDDLETGAGFENWSKILLEALIPYFNAQGKWIGEIDFDKHTGRRSIITMTPNNGFNECLIKTDGVLAEGRNWHVAGEDAPAPAEYVYTA